MDALKEMRSGKATWFGIGGGRGSAKSACIDRVALTELLDQPGTVSAIVMRTHGAVRKYHIEPLFRAFPELRDYYNISNGKLRLPVGDKFSELDIGYAENMGAVENFFRSGNYRRIYIDQAEQFSELELREIRKACRWAGGGGAKLMLSFNMGGASIGFLRKIFHGKEYSDRDKPENYSFLKLNPWDNVFWVMDALKADGLTEKDYYRWTDEERMVYAATRGEYTSALNADNDVIRARDWLGSWESLEGAYYVQVWDYDATVITPEQCNQLIKPWWKRWLSQDWGRSHYCTTQWHTRGDVSPKDALEILGWKIDKPVTVCLTYREYIAGGAAESRDEGGKREIAEQDIARQIVARTPADEREQLRRFFLSPDAFAKRSSANTIAQELGEILSESDLPRPENADNDRIGGWGLLYNLLLSTKRIAKTPERWAGEDVMLISANCPEIIRTIPLLMRDPKNLDDVLKTDLGTAKLEQDIADTWRYGWKSMLGSVKKPMAVVLQETLAAIPDMTKKHMAHLAFIHKTKKSSVSFRLNRRRQ